MTDFMNPPDTSKTTRSRIHVSSTALVVIATAVLGGLGASPARAVLRADGGGGSATPVAVTPPPPKTAPTSSVAPRQKVVQVLHSTDAFSTPYFNAARRHPLRPNLYVATCEAKSSQAGPFGNYWWSRLREGTWVNNGYLSGGEKMGLGDCGAPRNDGNTHGINLTHGVFTSTVYFNRVWTKDVAGAGAAVGLCGVITAIPGAQVLLASCLLEGAAIVVQARRADDRGMCLKLKVTNYPSVVWPDIYRGRYCN